MKDRYIIKFYNEISNTLEGNYKIILEPSRKLKDDWIEYDQVKWEMDEPIKNLVNDLRENKLLSLEEKILEVYKFICLNYIYDDNVLYFFRRNESDINNIKYIAVDWYGRIINETWKENRKKHNRRVCYEFARFYAKAINELIKESEENLEAFMVGDKENTHYVVGITGEKYSALLDLDDFNSIKDLTRLKLGLTIKGIKILRDEKHELQNNIDVFNKNRLNELIEIEKIEEKDTIKYLKAIVKVLKTYNIDSQGFMEYMRSKIESKDIEIEKIWKEIKGENEKRYVRCLLFEIDSTKYLLDSVEQTLNTVNIEELDNKIFIFKPEENEYIYYGG